MVSKLNNDRKAGEGAGQAIGRIYGKIGFGGLWNGLPVRIFMIGTLTAFQWLIYDSFKVYLGVSHAKRTIMRASVLTISSYLLPEVTDCIILYNTHGVLEYMQHNQAISSSYSNAFPSMADLARV
jgi:hypothetical protein